MSAMAGLKCKIAGCGLPVKFHCETKGCGWLLCKNGHQTRFPKGDH